MEQFLSFEYINFINRHCVSSLPTVAYCVRIQDGIFKSLNYYDVFLRGKAYEEYL